MKRFARSKVFWLAGATLALTAGTVAVSAADLVAPPAPPAPPSPPSPPSPPAFENTEHRVVIVEKHGGSDGKDYIRTITRDGKTFVFQTDRELSDDEVEQRINDAESRIPPVPSVADGTNRRVMKQRIVVMNDKGEDVTDVVTEESEHCKGKGAVSDVDSSAENDGKLTRVRVRFCGAPEGMEKHAMAEALKGVRQARDEIASDKSLSESIRGQILNDLDAEIARLSS